MTKNSPTAVIHLLPEALANQIAAGEVVQRPASVVKELLENAVDAGAEHIHLILREAGKQLIQVIDDGAGMSPADARMAFERHATSKIRTAEDLFRIGSFGFRGEALASIASVAQVQLITRQQTDELGTELTIQGGVFDAQQQVQAAAGTSLAVRNLFYNIPARRKFLKGNPIETRHCLSEFTRVALAYPALHLRLTHNDVLVHDLTGTSLEGRVLQLHDFLLPDDLLPVEQATQLLSISGFVGRPQVARKARGDQFFLVNRRYVRDGYLHHAVATAYQDLIPKDAHPVYYLHLTLDPAMVDVNIHPTKTEIKFEDERSVYQLLHSAVRQVLGKLLGAPDAMPAAGSMEQAFYTPLLREDHITLRQYREGSSRDQSVSHYTDLPTNLLLEPEAAHTPALFERTQPQHDFNVYQLLATYLVLEQPEGACIIDQHLAHQRVLYDQLLAAGDGQQQSVQQLLYPHTFRYSADEYLLMEAALPDLLEQGFDIRAVGGHTLLVCGVPYEMRFGEVPKVMDALLADLKDAGRVRESVRQTLARAVARKTAIPRGQRLSADEMQTLVAALLASSAPQYAPGGEPTQWFLSRTELASRLLKKQ